GENQVWLWDLAGKREPRTLGGYAYSVDGLTISPDGKTLVIPGDAEDIWVWDVETEKVRAKWPTDFGRAQTVQFTRNGRVLLAAGGYGNFAIRINPGMVSFREAVTGTTLYSLR